jgi:group I intron endonuclease
VGVVYRISNSINEKLYIGKTIEDPIKYWKYHKSYCRNNYKKVLYSAMRKYGIDKFKFHILEYIESDNIEQLNIRLFKLEKEYINKLNTIAPAGYNVTAGGQGLAGMEFSEEHRQKISNKLSGRKFSKTHRKNISKSAMGRTSPNKNKKLSKKHKENLSKSMQGKYDGKNNPFYGKKHDKQTRKLISKKLSDGRLNGENNPFYGKNIQKILLKN